MKETKSSQPIYYELSHVQKRLFCLQELEKDTLIYNLPLILKLNKSLHLQQFKEAVFALVNKYEVLRTTFKIVNKQPVQFITNDAYPDITIYKKNTFLSAKEVVNNFIAPFNLMEKTPLRIAILELDAETSLLLIDTHEILMDVFSQRKIVKELFRIYNGTSKNNDVVSVTTSLKNQEQTLKNAKVEKQESFWLQQFTEYPERLELPVDFTRPLLKLYTGKRVSVTLEKPVFLKLRQTAKNVKTGTFEILLSIFNILLSKIGNLEDITIGTKINARQSDSSQNLIGNFTNTVALRNKPLGNLQFNTFLKQVAAHSTSCFANQAYPYECLVEALDLDRNMNRNPLFDVMFLYETLEEAEIKIDGIEQAPYQHGPKIAKLDLTLTAIEGNENVELHFDYATKLFKEETILRFAEYFKNIAEAVAEKPGIKLHEIDLLEPAEKTKLLIKFNDTFSTLPEDETIFSLFTQQVQKTPNATALVAGNNKITYHQLNEKVARLAGYLKQNHLQQGNLVAVLTTRSPDYIVAVLAIIKNFATFLPIDYLNPDERINYLLNQSKVSFLISTDSIVSKKEINYKGKLVLLDKINTTPAETILLKNSLQKNNDRLYVIYTSGTTGFPKGVINTERGLLNRLYWGWKQYGFGKEEVCCQKTGLGFTDHIAEIFSPLLKGIPLVFIEDEEVRSVEGLANTIDQKKITRIVLVPSLLKALLKHKKQGKSKLESLKYIFSSGESLTIQLANEFYEEFQSTRLINIYGSSEVSADVSYYEVPRFKVTHILSYFKNLTETEQRFRYLKNQASNTTHEDYFTTPNVALTDLVENFKISKVSERLISVEEYNRRLEEEVIPYTINTASPTFIGHMTSALPDFVHDLSKLISQMNQNLVKIETSKSLTLLEREAIAMLHRLFYRLPNNFYDTNIQKVNTNMGIIASGGTTANISAILAARNRILFENVTVGQNYKKPNVYNRLNQLGYKDMVVIGSELMHYSFKKTASLLGFGSKNIINVPNDENGILSIAELKKVIERCKKEKLLIIAVVGIAGSTERGSIDPLTEIGEITEEYGIHFHVDAAWGGAVMFSETYKSKLKGIEKATSITICGHKQLFLPQGISVCLFKDINYLGYNSVTANYQAQPNTFDFGRFTLEGSRPAMSLCLHAALRILGLKGYELLVDNGIEKAKTFASLIASHEAFQLFSCQLNILNYRYIPIKYRHQKYQGIYSAEINEEINQINQQIQYTQFIRGKTFVSKTYIKDASGHSVLVFRTVISNPLTTPKDLIDVLNDQFAIIKDILDEENSLFKADADELQIEKAYQIKQEEETSVSIGKPIENIRILILDKYGNLQPEGVPGEICVEGIGLAGEYLNNPEETAKAFIKTNYFNESILYKSGDIGKWNHDGTIAYLGRKDDQVQLNGFRIELLEIAYHLNTHTFIEQAVVLVKTINREKYLVAYCIGEAKTNIAEIKSYLAERLPFYMIPTYFVLLKAFPINANGKIDRKALLKLEIKPQNSFKKPTTQTEKQIADIWAEILDMETGSLGLGTNFFDIGGRSLLIIELTRQINTHFNSQLTAREIFLKPTIQQQAALITTS